MIYWFFCSSLCYFISDVIVVFCGIAERNLNPKAACLKRREEEKTEEQQAGRSMVVPPHDIGHQVPLVRLFMCYINFYLLLNKVCSIVPDVRTQNKIR